MSSLEDNLEIQRQNLRAERQQEKLLLQKMTVEQRLEKKKQLLKEEEEEERQHQLIEEGEKRRQELKLQFEEQTQQLQDRYEQLIEEEEQQRQKQIRQLQEQLQELQAYALQLEKQYYQDILFSSIKPPAKNIITKQQILGEGVKNGEATCLLCFEDYKPGDTIFLFHTKNNNKEAAHAAHFDCAKQMEINMDNLTIKCPLCREEISPDIFANKYKYVAQMDGGRHKSKKYVCSCRKNMKKCIKSKKTQHKHKSKTIHRKKNAKVSKR
jgi:hypothetical protein